MLRVIMALAGVLAAPPAGLLEAPPPPFPFQVTDEGLRKVAATYCLPADVITCGQALLRDFDFQEDAWNNHFTTEKDRAVMLDIIAKHSVAEGVRWYEVKPEYQRYLQHKLSASLPASPAKPAGQCWMDYCPCADEVNVTDHGICRDLEAGLTVSPETMSIAAKLHDIDKEQRNSR